MQYSVVPWLIIVYIGARFPLLPFSVSLLCIEGVRQVGLSNAIKQALEQCGANARKLLFWSPWSCRDHSAYAVAQWRYWRQIFFQSTFNLLLKMQNQIKFIFVTVVSKLPYSTQYKRDNKRTCLKRVNILSKVAYTPNVTSMLLCYFLLWCF